MASGLRLWDRLVLFLAWMVTCGLVYLLGFYVGKGVQEQRLEMEERVVRLPVTAAPPPEGQRPKSDLTFYDTLARSGERPATPAPEPAPAPKATTGTLPPRAAAPTPSTTLPPARTAATTPPAASPPRVVASPPPTTRPTTPPAERPTERVVSPPPPPEAPARSAARTEPAAPPRTEPPSGRGGWTVQASPTRSRDEAQALQKRLRSKGYDATVVEVPRDGTTWYRIRVGRYASAGQATEIMQRLRDQEGVSHVFVASE